MHRALCASCVGAGALLTVTLSLGAAQGVSIQVGQPGFYGRIDLGPLAPPPVLYPQPIVIQPAPVEVAPPPIYLRVPPGHAKQWRKHCQRYQACGQPVYFVRDSWYQDVYMPYYRTRDQRGHRHDYDEEKGHGKGHGKGHKGHGHGHDRD